MLTMPDTPACRQRFAVTMHLTLAELTLLNGLLTNVSVHCFFRNQGGMVYADSFDRRPGKERMVVDLMRLGEIISNELLKMSQNHGR